MTRPKDPQGLWVKAELKSGRVIDAVIPNDLLHFDTENIVLTIRPIRGKNRIVKQFKLTQFRQISIVGVMGKEKEWRCQTIQKQL